MQSPGHTWHLPRPSIYWLQESINFDLIYHTCHFQSHWKWVWLIWSRGWLTSSAPNVPLFVSCCSSTTPCIAGSTPKTASWASLWTVTTRLHTTAGDARQTPCLDGGELWHYQSHQNCGGAHLHFQKGSVTTTANAWPTHLQEVQATKLLSITMNVQPLNCISEAMRHRFFTYIFQTTCSIKIIFWHSVFHTLP